MAAKRILVDSSLIIDYFRKMRKEKAPLYRLFQLKYKLFISSLTVYELLCGAKTVQLQKDTENLLKLFEVLDFGSIEAANASEIYKDLKRKNKFIGAIDILIAATALSNSLEVSTLNEEHFKRVDNIILFKL